MKIFCLGFLAIFLSCKVERYSQQTPKLFFRIDFQEQYFEDTVTVRVNDCLIINGLEIHSDRSMGITDLSIDVNISKEKLFIRFLGVDKTCKSISEDELELFISVNGIDRNSILNVSLGSYIGVRFFNNKVEIIQSKKSFIYD